MWAELALLEQYQCEGWVTATAVVSSQDNRSTSLERHIFQCMRLFQSNFGMVSKYIYHDPRPLTEAANSWVQHNCVRDTSSNDGGLYVLTRHRRQHAGRFGSHCLLHSSDDSL